MSVIVANAQGIVIVNKLATDYSVTSVGHAYLVTTYSCMLVSISVLVI